MNQLTKLRHAPSFNKKHREHEIYTARRYAIATARFILNLHGIVYVPKRCSCGWWKLERSQNGTSAKLDLATKPTS